MKDQAEKLRQMFKNSNISQGSLNDSEKIKRNYARVITVTSGKGGVGKTNLTINLGIKLIQLGLKVIIIDADLGLSNIDVALGRAAKYNLSDVINYRKDILDIIEEGPGGIKFISGGSGVQELIKIDKNQLANLLIQLGKLDEEADVIFIDTGAGLSNNVLSFVYAAKEVILITTPEPTAITDAYALIKIISKKDKNKEIKLVINRAENAMEAENLLMKLNEVSEKFLGVTLHKLGYIINDPNVSKAVKLQQPFVLAYDKTEAAENVSDIAQSLINNKFMQHGSKHGIRLFVSKLKWFF